jgi:hypothetical protein
MIIPVIVIVKEALNVKSCAELFQVLFCKENDKITIFVLWEFQSIRQPWFVNSWKRYKGNKNQNKTLDHCTNGPKVFMLVVS